MHVRDLCVVLGRDPKRARDLTRRKRTPKGRDGLAVMLEDAGVFAISADRNYVEVSPEWVLALYHAQLVGEELAADELQRARDRRASEAYRMWRYGKWPRGHRRGPTKAGVENVERSRATRARPLAQPPPPPRPKPTPEEQRVAALADQGMDERFIRPKPDPERRKRAIAAAIAGLFAQRPEYRSRRVGQIVCQLPRYLGPDFPRGPDGLPKDAEVEEILAGEAVA
jgi:hypothetical protein